MPKSDQTSAMQLKQLDLIVRDVPAGTAFFTSLLGVEPRVAEDRFAEFDLGGFTLMLSPDAMVPIAPARGVILHIEVDDLEQATERAEGAGAEFLLGPLTTDWGTRSVLVQGPENVVVDLYQSL
jgi:catechol 2,3-dioxygenase-like lactoylglutathione lyase family enzyme